MRWLAPLVLCGCVTQAVVGYQYRVKQDFGGGEEPEMPMVEARQLLGGSRSVAFYPPDACLNTQAGEQRAKELRASCGVLLSTLERAAERAGYEVMSWQNLRGDKRPIEYAREAKVDILFEINEFDIKAISDAEVERALTFFQIKDNVEQPLPLSQADAEKCRDYALAKDPPQTAALTGTIDIKTVSVADGRSRWRYRKTLQVSTGRVYPRVLFNQALCDDRWLIASPQGQPEPQGPMVTSMTFTETRTADPDLKRKEQIRDQMIGQFVEVLREAHAPKPAGNP